MGWGKMGHRFDPAGTVLWFNNAMMFGSLTELLLLCTVVTPLAPEPAQGNTFNSKLVYMSDDTVIINGSVTHLEFHN